MKKNIKILIIILGSVLIANAQWLPDIRLTYNVSNSRTSDNNAFCVAANGNIVHAVWFDDRESLSNYEIFYKHSTNNGTNWQADVRLTFRPNNSRSPSIAVSASIVHVVWYEETVGNGDIFYRRSIDNGVNWEQEVQLTNNSFFQGYPSVAVNGLNVHLVWNDNRDNSTGRQVYYKRSTDGGLSWSGDIRLNNKGYSSGQCISVTGSKIHVVWSDTRDYPLPDILYKHSSDNGLSWNDDIKLTNDYIDSRFPSISSSGEMLHVVWWDKRDGNFNIYYKRSTNSGLNWSQDTGLTNDPQDSFNPSITSSGSLVHVVWNDWRDSNHEIYYKRSTNYGISWFSDSRLTNNSYVSTNPSITYWSTTLHIVWTDTRDGNSEIYFKRDTTGNIVSINKVYSTIPINYKLYQNYPNPFNPVTKIRFNIPPLEGDRGRIISLIIYDILVREVATLTNEQLQPGTYEVEFDGSNYSSGVYYYKLTAGDYTDTKKMVLVK